MDPSIEETISSLQGIKEPSMEQIFQLTRLQEKKPQQLANIIMQQQAQIDIPISDQKDKDGTIRVLLENNEDTWSGSEMSTATTITEKESKQKEDTLSLVSTNSRKRSLTSKVQHTRPKKPATEHTKQAVAVPTNTYTQTSAVSVSDKSQSQATCQTLTKERTSEEAQRAQPKAKKPSPIHLRTKEGWPELQHQLRQHGAEITSAKNLRDSIQVQVATTDHFRAATSRLDALNVPYHTYALPEEKTIRAVIKGIPEGISTEEIKRELEKRRRQDIRSLPPTGAGSHSLATETQVPNRTMLQMPRLRALRPWLSRRPEMREPGQWATDTAPRGSRPQSGQQQANRPRPSPVVPGNRYAACAATNRPATTQPRQFKSPATGHMQSAGLINEVIGSFANLADELKKQTTRPKSLKIAFWNIAGLRSGRNEAELFADDHNIDVLLLNETHLRACDNPKIRNYSLYRTNRDGAGGGTAIYIRSSLVSATAVNIEATAVVILTASGPLRLTAVYKSPNKTLLDADLESLLVTGQPTIIAGDLNVKDPSWNSRVTNRSGIKLRDFADTHNIAVYGPIEPTAGHRPDVLDRPCRSSTVTCSPPLKTPAELDQAVEQLSKCIHSALENSSRVITTPVGKNDVPPEIRELMRRKN
ncbi:hypothetical protein CBL_05159 [Carabus blaptoides fortunei]